MNDYKPKSYDEMTNREIADDLLARTFKEGPYFKEGRLKSYEEMSDPERAGYLLAMSFEDNPFKQVAKAKESESITPAKLTKP